MNRGRCKSEVDTGEHRLCYLVQMEVFTRACLGVRSASTRTTMGYVSPARDWWAPIRRCISYPCSRRQIHSCFAAALIQKGGSGYGFALLLSHVPKTPGALPGRSQTHQIQGPGWGQRGCVVTKPALSPKSHVLASKSLAT